ncbi:I78 family peptidase inhibitor [Tabrizicola oligotrophica]|uniref:Peptidase inhibitor I78 family protein n=1 Tax=Tabrizicola oligotrophica TaxID=2710650 RepID=A0A6M0QSR9_9RHOB|nr:I78 family peptidase inhibitor [Tabrizicola oligotrophica]NEY90051.1 hypothetical protein [Tabrizicola oligotrophica]
MRAFALLLPLVFAACAAGEAPPDPGMIDPQVPPADACGASDLQYLLGQPESELQTLQFAGPVRIIHPGTAVTMDYSESRLNIEIDDAGKISRLSCG